MWDYQGLQPSEVYTKSAYLGIDQGVPAAYCTATDILVSVQSFTCNGSYAGMMEGVARVGANGAAIYCDLGNNATYDGGYIEIACASR